MYALQRCVIYGLPLNVPVSIVLNTIFLFWHWHHVSKNCANLFLSELRQITTNFDNFWQRDGKEARIMRIALIFHLA